MEEQEIRRIKYSYKHVPTLRRFSESRARQRAVTGPFGSGKSSACVIECINIANEQKPMPDGVRRVRIAVVRNCYDDQTEILTEKRGWQLFKNLSEDDKVATLVGEDLVYQKPNGVAAFPYKGEMIGFEGEGANFLVTPDHKMWVSKRRTRKKVWGDFEIATAEEIYGSQTVRVRREAKWTGEDTDLPKDVFEWLGFWFAEGSYGVYGKKYGRPNRERIVVTQCKKEGIEYIRRVMVSAGLEWSEWKRKSGINFVLKRKSPFYKEIEALVKNAGKSREKKIPLKILNSPPQHLRCFLRGMIWGDGSVYGGTTRIATSSKKMADDLQEIALKAGQVANVAMTQDDTGRAIYFDGVKKGQSNGPSYGVTILVPKKYRPILHVNPKHTNKLLGWYKKPYDGIVYCVEMDLVPVYVRRKGKGFWCLRTYLQLKDTTIKTFHHWIPPHYFGQYNQTAHDYFITGIPAHDGGPMNIEVLFRALDRPDQLRNLLSMELTCSWFNEVREIPRMIWDTMDGRVGRFPSIADGGATWAGIFADTNPPDTDHWFYKLFEKEKPIYLDGKPKTAIFHQPSGRAKDAENIPNLEKGYYENLQLGKSNDFVRVYVDGEYGFVSDGKPVYPNWSPVHHVAPQRLEPIKALPIVIGFDFALHPACVVIQQIPNGPRLNVLDEWTGEDITVRRFLQEIVLPQLQSKYMGMEWYITGDPSGAKRQDTDARTAFLELKDNGLPAIPARSNTYGARIPAVDNWLTKPFFETNEKTGVKAQKSAFQVSPHCEQLVRGFNGAYMMRRVMVVGHERYMDVPEKTIESHPHDALQYACMLLETGLKIRRTLSQRGTAGHEPPPPTDAWT